MRTIDADALKKHIDGLPALPDGNFAGNHSALKALINLQPTINPEPRWIPCSERLPIKDEPVFVYLFGDSPYLAWWNGRDWDTEDFTVDRSEEPIAWLPLPEPFREGESE